MARCRAAISALGDGAIAAPGNRARGDRRSVPTPERAGAGSGAGLDAGSGAGLGTELGRWVAAGDERNGECNGTLAGAVVGVVPAGEVVSVGEVVPVDAGVVPEWIEEWIEECGERGGDAARDPAWGAGSRTEGEEWLDGVEEPDSEGARGAIGVVWGPALGLTRGGTGAIGVTVPRSVAVCWGEATSRTKGGKSGGGTG